MDNSLLQKKIASCLVFLCIGIGSIVRIIYLWLYPVQPRDAFKYKEFIEAWNMTGEYPTFYPFPPLGIYLLKIPQYLHVDNLFTCGVIVNMVLGLCIIGLIMKISSAIFPSSLLTACVGITVATHPTFVHYSCQMLRENSFLFFSCLGILLMIYYVLLSSFCAIAACLCRYEALELCLVMGASVLLVPEKKRMKRIQHLFLFVAGCIVSIILISYTIGIPLDYYWYALAKEIATRKA